MSGFGEFFGKYIGVVGILAIGFGAGFIIAPFADVVLPEGYTELMALCIGFFTARNGPAYAAKANINVFDRSG